MSDEAIHTGGCLCGAVRFEARGQPVNVRLCHCRPCQKAMGAPYFARALFPIDQVTVTGQTQKFASSDMLSRVFCPTCGSRLFALRPDLGRMGVAIAAFDTPNDFPPQCHFFVESKVGWLRIDDGLPQYDEWPPA